MSFPPIRPFIPDKIQKIFDNPKKLQELVSYHDGPIHVLVPELMDLNIELFKAVFGSFDIDYRIHYAHKANKSTALLLQAKKNGISIDVASEAELVHALSCWFQGKDISCTWPKNISFLFLSLSHGCLISIDSLSELKNIINLNNSYSFDKINLLLRFNDLSSSDRIIIKKHTKFWISQHDLPDVFWCIKDYKNIFIQGIHFHFDEHQADIKSWAIENCLSLMYQLHQNWHTPYLIDIWWWYRGEELLDRKDWDDYIDYLANCKKNNEDTHTRWNHWFWLHMNNKWALEGREVLSNRFVWTDPCLFLRRMLEKSYAKINDSFFTLMIEPWYSLTNNVGFSLVKIESLKKDNKGNDLLVVNANIQNLSNKMWDYFFDPLLLPSRDWVKEDFNWYIVGNLCREVDVLIKKKICFHQKPQVWDIIIFPNTSAYLSDFEDGSPIMHTLWKKFIAHFDENDDFSFSSDTLYNLL